MSALPFLFGFLVTGIIGARALTGFETTRPDQIGAEGSLFLLCVIASVLSVVSYLLGAGWLQRYPGRIAGLIGGVVAALIFCGSAGTVYLGAYFAFSATLALMLPGLVAFAWPLLTARRERLEQP